MFVPALFVTGCPPGSRAAVYHKKLLKPKSQMFVADVFQQALGGVFDHIEDDFEAVFA